MITDNEPRHNYGLEAATVRSWKPVGHQRKVTLTTPNLHEIRWLNKSGKFPMDLRIPPLIF